MRLLAVLVAALIALAFLVVVRLWPAGPLDKLPPEARDKAQPGLLERFHRGETPTVLVELDAIEVRARAEVFRLSEGLRVGDERILEMKRSDYFELRHQVFNDTSLSGIKILRSFRNLPLALLDIPSEAQLASLLLRHEVIRIWAAGRIVYPALDPTLTLIGQPGATNHRMIGKDVAVAVLDTGINCSDPAFGGCDSSVTCCRVVANVDVLPYPNDPCEDPSHGTTVAGVVSQVAPGADIVAIDIEYEVGFFLPRCGSDATAMLLGIDWVLDHLNQYNFVTINLSWADGQSYGDSNCPTDIDAAFTEARLAGIMPVAAAGNAGFTSGVEWPACSPLAIAVASVTLGDEITFFSSIGPNLDLLAPGLAGTSVAAPVVSGAWAIMKSAHPYLTVEDGLAALRTSGHMVEHALTGLIFPRVELDAALGLGVTIRDGLNDGDLFGKALATGDFNGDGRDDLAVGVPQEDIQWSPTERIVDAGAVNIVYGSKWGLLRARNQIWLLDTNLGLPWSASDGDLFGASLTSGDFDRDGHDDLAIGAPGVKDGAGSVFVLYGSYLGLSAIRSQKWEQGNLGPYDVPEPFDGFGRSLASGDFNGDGRDDLAIGVPERNVFDSDGQLQDAAGRVELLFAGPQGLDSAGVQLFSQLTGGPKASAEYGSSLTVGDFDGDRIDDLAVGIPGESFDSNRGFLAGAGAAEVIYGTSQGFSLSRNQFLIQEKIEPHAFPEMYSQTGDRFGFSLAAGDFDDDGRDELAIGVPGEDTCGLRDAGAVEVLHGTSMGLSRQYARLWAQDAQNGFCPGRLFGPAEAFDYFGSSLVVGDFDHNGADDLAIGVPGDDWAAPDGGIVNVVYGAASQGLDPNYNEQVWAQSENQGQYLAETPEAGDFVGSILASGDFDGDFRADLVVGVPFEDFSALETRHGCSSQVPADAGLVHVIYGSAWGLYNKVTIGAYGCAPAPCDPGHTTPIPDGARPSDSLQQGL